MVHILAGHYKELKKKRLLRKLMLKFKPNSFQHWHSLFLSWYTYNIWCYHPKSKRHSNQNTWYLFISYTFCIHNFYLLCNIENQLWILKAILSVVIDSNIEEIICLYFLYLSHKPSFLMGDFETVICFFNLANLKWDKLFATSVIRQK